MYLKYKCICCQLFLALAFAGSNSAFGQDDWNWVYPNSKRHTEATDAESSSPVVSVRSTEDSVKKVVTFYAGQSGIDKDWSFLDKEFPPTKQAPIGFLFQEDSEKKTAVRVSVLHDLRPEVANVSFVVFRKGAVDTVSISRGAKESKTWIQIHSHASAVEKPKR